MLAAVHHAEMVAHRVGEPFGSLMLAVAVTVIEVGLIVTLMSSGGQEASTLARDTVFAAVMISINGIVGLALLVGAVRHGLAVFNAEGTGSALATVITLASLCLVLPTFTTSAPGPEYSTAQLAFAAVASLALYGLFVFTQTVRHRDFFLPVRQDGSTVRDGVGHGATARATGDVGQPRPAAGRAGRPWSAWPRWSRRRSRTPCRRWGSRTPCVGVVIALLVLLPEIDRGGPRRGTRAGPGQPQPRLRVGDGLASG